MIDKLDGQLEARIVIMEVTKVLNLAGKHLGRGSIGYLRKIIRKVLN